MMAIEASDNKTFIDDDKVKKRNPAILAILDPLHRSLLTNNLRYEQANISNDQATSVANDSDEYLTAVSEIVSTKSAVVYDSNKFIDAKQIDSNVKGHRQLNQTHQKNIDLRHDTLDSDNHLSEQTRQFKLNSKQTSQQFEQLNVLDTKNRCDTIYLANASSLTQQQQQQKHRFGSGWSRSHEHITHKLNRRSIRNSLENKAPLSSCCNSNRTTEDYHSKRGICKRIPLNEYSDSSDVNSEQNLVIENMRNRECEMYRKISFNNGYFDTTDSSSSGSYMYRCRSHSNSVESTSLQSSNNGRNKKCLCKINQDLTRKLPTKRKCRSFPLTENRKIEENSTENVIQNQRNTTINCSHNNVISSETETNTYQTNSRKITITIKTKTIPDQSNQLQQNQSKTIDKYLTNGSESSEESDTTVSDYATLCSESDVNAIQIHQANNEPTSDCESSNESQSSDDNSFFSLKSDIECQSESSQYFNCASFIDVENVELSTENHFITNENNFPNDDNYTTAKNNDIKSSKYEKNQREIKQIHTKTIKHFQTKTNKQSKNVTMKKSTTPMICIEQELCENRIVTSKIEVDKEKIKEFKRRHKKRSQPKIIIDNSFSEDIFNETLNRSTREISCDKSIIDDIVSSLDANKCEQNYQKSVKNSENVRNKFICDGFTFGKLQASPKYTGKSINRLLAHRIEQQSITSVRRTLLQNVAYAITEKEKLQKLEKKKLIELAPIKPPRSFTASSSSSPLSKQSFESSATIPISELNRHDQGIIGFAIPAQIKVDEARYDPVSEEATVQFGWIRPESNLGNDEPPSHYATADQFSNSNSYTGTKINVINPVKVNTVHKPTNPAQMGFYIPKENIDMVDSSSQSYRHSNKDFERFSAVLSENRLNNLSTPIKELAVSINNTQYVTADEAPVKTIQKIIQSTNQPDILCQNCHCKVKKEKPQHNFMGKTGKRIGKAAIKRTKTFIGSSKKFLKKPLTKETSVKKTKPKEDLNEEIYSTPLKDGDNTVCNNRDTISREDNKKRVNKSLNLTPKPINENIVELNPSPKRTAETSNVRLLKDASKPLDAKKSLDESEQYATPDEAFDFERVVNLPSDQVKVVKRSPSKMILMQLAKSSKKLFNKKSRDKDKRRSSTDESTHYYKANDYDEVDNKVLLMGEMLSVMRKQIENGQGGSTSNLEEEIAERPPSAKKCLFRDRTISTSSGDLLDQESIVEQIATIDLHDEPDPEPLYAEIEQSKPTLKRQDTFYHSCVDDDVNAISSCSSSEPIQLKEVYISDRSDSQPSKYIMVNNNPKILYATINRNSMQTRSLETIESRTEQSEDQVNDDQIERQSFQLSTSYESLNISLINDFATAVQTELDECQFKMNNMFITATNEPDLTGYDEIDAPKIERKSNSGSESIATSDLNSGCSSFYRRNKNIISNRSRKSLSEFIDCLSLDTAETGSYCESLSRGNDLNTEIKDTIASLEYMPSEMSNSTDLSHDFATNVAFRTCTTENNTSKDSTKFVSFNRPDCDSINSSPSSSLYRSISKAHSPSKILQKMSPSLKSIKTKLRNSFRTDHRKTGKNESFLSVGIGSDETTDLKSCTSSSSGSSNDLQRKKLFESICSRFEMMPNESLANGIEMKHLIERIRQQQEMRKSIQSALEVCRTNGEFHNSRELVEAEQLMLMSSLKECSALEKLITLWQCDNETSDSLVDNLGEGVLTIKYLEFELKVDSIFDTHFNYFYICVCSYRDQVEFTESKERNDNRIVFNNLKIQFHNLTSDFEIRVEIYALRLRKNQPSEKSSEPFIPQLNSSRFRLQGRTLLTSSNLSRKHSSSSYHSPRKLQRCSSGKYIYTTYGLISPAIVLCGQNALCDSLKIGYQEQIYFQDSAANGFLNIADSKQKWDRLWCRIDGFSMNFWNYPQDLNDTQSPILTLSLDQCNYRTKSLLVDREICPRPRSFKIDVVHADSEKRDRNRCIQSYFISAENQLDLELWLSEIQKIFEMIKSWNI